MPFKIAIGLRISEEPGGGGFSFARSIKKYLSDRGHAVVDHADGQSDIILVLDPRVRSNFNSIGFIHIFLIRFFYKNPPIIIHRINDCDERKGTRFTNLSLRLTNALSDYTIFISNWLKELDVYCPHIPSTVIQNGADTSIFFPRDYFRPPRPPFKIVTHHWAGNYRKGFDFYVEIDRIIRETELGPYFSFTYIGNLPDGLSLPNTKVISPLFGARLAEILRDSDMYITGSHAEPAGMHHIEARLCGLPVIYRDSGALPEYCDGKGFKVGNAGELFGILKAILESPDIFNIPLDSAERKLKSSGFMSQKYLELFDNLIVQRKSKKMSPASRLEVCKRLLSSFGGGWRP